MTPPAGPEEVREPDFEAALKEARSIIAIMGGAFPQSAPLNLARAYIASRDRREAELEAIHGYVGQFHEATKGTVAHRFLVDISAFISSLRWPLKQPQPSRLAKLEQERGRGEG